MTKVNKDKKTTSLVDKINKQIETKKRHRDAALRNPAFIANQGKHIANLKTPSKTDIRNPHGDGGEIGGALKALSEYFKPVLNYPLKVKMPGGEEEVKTIMDQIIMKLTAKALQGDIKAVELILNRNFGKEDQKLILQLTHEEALKQLKKEEEGE